MMKYETSIKALKVKLKKEPNLTKEEWDSYAKEQKLFSANTIYAHEDVLNWEQLKKKLRKKDKRLESKIEKIRQKLNKVVEETGIDSEETLKLSKEINELINIYYATREITYTKNQKDYPKDSEIWETYQKSYIELRNNTMEKKQFPSTKKWNNFAKRRTYLNCQAIEYISGLTWNEMREKILKEI